MNYVPKSPSQKRLPILVIASLITACGSGSSPSSEATDLTQLGIGTGTDDQQNIVQASGEQGDSAVNGTIIIEERNGKSVFDAYFSKSALADQIVEPKENIGDMDVCDVSKVHSIVTNSSSVELGAANGDAQFASIGDAFTIESRVGQFEALIKQQVGQMIVYAPEDRWRSIALPDDASLSFENSTILDHLGSVELSSLTPLVWLAPSTGVMTNPASSLSWEASVDMQSRINLRLSALDFSDSEKPEVVTVSCNLVDDGTFTLPVEFQQQLPDDDMGIVVYAVREHVQEISVDDASLTVVQLSYPAPLAP